MEFFLLQLFVYWSKKYGLSCHVCPEVVTNCGGGWRFFWKIVVNYRAKKIRRFGISLSLLLGTPLNILCNNHQKRNDRLLSGQGDSDCRKSVNSGSSHYRISSDSLAEIWWYPIEWLRAGNQRIKHFTFITFSAIINTFFKRYCIDNISRIFGHDTIVTMVWLKIVGHADVYSIPKLRLLVVYCQNKT